jgi:hypothetical protein
MPGLLRGVARTAVVAGTATAVSGRVQRRQAEKFADRDAAIYADRDAAYSQQTGQPLYTQPVYTTAPVYAAAPQPAAQGDDDDTLDQLRELAEMRNQGILSDQEFAAAKAKILGG